MDVVALTDDPWTRSQLFTVRLWYELVDTDRWEVRMQAKHILTGETRYFREWSLWAIYLAGKLDTPDAEESSEQLQDGESVERIGRVDPLRLPRL